ncbi:hypothetical protein HZI73_12225 [Vallitalea pronyensis]|uniref:Uncharacterized protein n=1 Tax=Vallitalea pronyensis TaxID=1348613 RepID=A0A8J8MJV4_9FIRM|nr:hypothetical protein [Vallitalea pronyensis]QUI23010.1 hypothetical protein HZI73_12225 [Vallitalea pronyensis]
MYTTINQKKEKENVNANGYANYNNISDYYNIRSAMQLDEYKVHINFWQPTKKTIAPFDEWKSGHSLNWYQSYNAAKHDRHVNFSKANLDMLIHAIAGVYVILYAQFGVYTFNPYQEVQMYGDNDDGSIFGSDSIFSIMQPSWDENKKYNFDWENIKNDNEPINKYGF